MWNTVNCIHLIFIAVLGHFTLVTRGSWRRGNVGRGVHWPLVKSTTCVGERNCPQFLQYTRIHYKWVRVCMCVCVIVCYCHCAVYQANKSPVMLYAKQLRDQRGRERWKKTGSQLLIIARNTIPQKPPARRRLMSPYPVPLSMCCCSFPRVALCVCVCWLCLVVEVLVGRTFQTR